MPRSIPTSRRRRAALGALAWVLTLGAVRALVLQPERCGTVTVERLDAAIDETIGWATRTQAADGRWIYRYDARTDTDLGYYELVRHSGLTMALYQAAVAGFPEARQPAERADAYARASLVGRDGWQALAPLAAGARYDTGATALFANAVLYRRELTGTTDDDALLVELGRFLVRNVAPSGAVAASFDPVANEPLTDTSSPFFTGEVLWALARLERAFPGEWREPALRVARYIATERDDAEGRWPDVADHWASYAFAEMSRWPGPPVLDATLVDYAWHVADLEGLSIRYESQRTGSAFSTATRGPVALPAGVGTVGEALASLRMVPALAGDDALRERTSCTAGVLLARQVTAAQAARYPSPERTRGTWIRDGITQIDDQQHAMSALVLVRSLEAKP